MECSSRSDIYPIADVDDFYYSALYDEDGIFPISDDEYAHELQLQEALIYSVSHTNASSSSHKYTSSSSKKAASSSSSKKVASSPSSSKMGASSSSLLKKLASSSSSLIPETSSSSKKLKRKRSVEAELLCGICMDTKAPSEMFSNAGSCRHLYCSDCIRQHVSIKIKENIAKLKCPHPNCKRVIGPEACRSIIPKKVLERWEDALCESMILATQKFYCPFKDCSAMLVDDGVEAVTSSECPNCNRLFCAQCKVAWHSEMNCSEFKSLKKGDRNPEDILLVKLAKKKKWKRCPKCKFYVQKRDGCNHIACRCGYDFCYGCGKKYDGYHSCRLRD